MKIQGNLWPRIVRRPCYFKHVWSKTAIVFLDALANSPICENKISNSTIGVEIAQKCSDLPMWQNVKPYRLSCCLWLKSRTGFHFSDFFLWEKTMQESLRGASEVSKWFKSDFLLFRRRGQKGGRPPHYKVLMVRWWEEKGEEVGGWPGMVQASRCHDVW